MGLLGIISKDLIGETRSRPASVIPDGPYPQESPSVDCTLAETRERLIECSALTAIAKYGRAPTLKFLASSPLMTHSHSGSDYESAREGSRGTVRETPSINWR